MRLVVGSTFALGFVVASVRSSNGSVPQLKDPSLGRWVLNVAKSTYQSGGTPKSMTVAIEMAGGELTVTAMGLGAKGEPLASTYRATIDGKDHPVTGAPSFDAIAITQIDRFTRETTRKKGGVAVQTARSVVSADGKTLTVTSRVNRSPGGIVTDVSVYDRQ